MGVLDDFVSRPGDRQLPTFLGMPVKQVSLITLTFQNSALILILHYSRIMPTPGGHRYFPSTAVFLCEVVKLCVSLTLAVHDASRRHLAPSAPPAPSTAPRVPCPASRIFREIWDTVFSPDSWKLAIPAALYTLQNTLLYAAVGNLEAVHYQVLYQLKILTTALFSVLLLRRPLPVHRWAALLLLTAGISVVSLAPASPDAAHRPIALHDTSDHFFPRSAHELAGGVSAGSGTARELTRRTVDAVAVVAVGGGGGGGGGLSKRSATYEGIDEDAFGEGASYAVGLSAVLAAAAVSGLAGVFLESVLKSSPAAAAGAASTAPYRSSSFSQQHATIWTRNIQLSFYSLFVALFGLAWRDGADIAEHGFFDGYTWVVWTVVVFQASDGLLASLCIQYADNIAKNFATSFSIVLSFLFSVIFFDFATSFAFLLGTSLVLGSAYLYSLSSPYAASSILSHANRAPRPSPLRIPSYGKPPAPLGQSARTPQGFSPRIPSQTRLPALGTPHGGGAPVMSEAGLLGVEPFDSRAVGLTTSRPSSPMVPRGASLGRGKRDN